MQLYLFIPALVLILHVKLKEYLYVQWLIIVSMIASGTYISFKILDDNNINACLYAPQDIDAYRLWLNKPYTKIHCVAYGFILARTFHNINALKSQLSIQEVRSKVFYGLFKRGCVATFAFMMIFASLVFITTYPTSANEK